jgi:hypothetical protein
MKKIAVIYLTILTLCLNAQVSNNNNRTDNSNKSIQKGSLKKKLAGYKYYNLKGKVKSIEEKRISDGELISIYFIAFDNEGKILTETRTYSTYGMVQEYTYTYNESGFVNTSTITTKSKSGTNQTNYIEEYDLNGNNIVTLRVGENYKTKRLFDEKGYVISSSDEENGKLLNADTYINNKYGNPTFESSSNGSSIITYNKYDGKFNWVEKTSITKLKKDNTKEYISKTFRTIAYY